MIKPTMHMKKIYGLLMVLLISSCYTKYKVNQGGIRSNAMITKLIIIKIDSIKSYDKWGIPEKVSFSDQSYSLVHAGKEASKKISFFKETTGYLWAMNKDTVKVLPASFSAEGWYYISGAGTFDRASSNIVYYIDKKRTIKQYNRSYY
jgi:hypothetical protein